jgi:hypothetical protein
MLAPRSPRYYAPPGVDLPAHARITAGHPLRRGVGPDVAGGGPGGGRVTGPYAPGEPDWIKTPAGWWVHACAVPAAQGGKPVLPPDLLRDSALPGVAVGLWLVPQLLNPDGTWSGARFLRFADDGSLAWSPREMAEHRDVANRLRGVLRLRADPAWRERSADLLPELTDLAVRLLAINHHISAHELVAWNWMMEGDVIPFVMGGLGVDLAGGING